MITKESLLPIGRRVHLNNESKIARVRLEGLEATHEVIGHTDDSVIFKSVNGSRVREISNLNIHYLLTNKYGGYNGEVLECRGKY